MNDFTASILNRIETLDKKDIRIKNKSELDSGYDDEIIGNTRKCNCDNCNKDDLSYEDGYSDYENNNERECICGCCDYCKGYGHAEFDSEEDDDNCGHLSSYDNGYSDYEDNYVRICNCGDCSYCIGYDDAKFEEECRYGNNEEDDDCY